MNTYLTISTLDETNIKEDVIKLQIIHINNCEYLSYNLTYHGKCILRFPSSHYAGGAFGKKFSDSCLQVNIRHDRAAFVIDEWFGAENQNSDPIFVTISGEHAKIESYTIERLDPSSVDLEGIGSKYVFKGWLSCGKPIIKEVPNY